MNVSSRWAFRFSRSLPSGVRSIASPARGRVSPQKSPRAISPRNNRNPPNPGKQEPAKKQDEPSKSALVSQALRDTAEDPQNRLLSPVHVPEDPHAILKEAHPAVPILANSTVVVQRQIEMMNVFLGFEQANKYVIMDPHGNHIGYLAEQEHGMGNMMARQMLKTHRSFTTHVFDRNETEVLRFHRPFSWINSRIKVYDAADADASGLKPSAALQNVSAGSMAGGVSQISSSPLSSMHLVGEAHQQWAPLRRRYNLFMHRPDTADPSVPQLTSGDLSLSNSTALEPVDPNATADPSGILAQFAYVNEPFLSWDFTLRSSNEDVIGSVNRNFAGWGRELFTDTGVYALRMDSESLAHESTNLAQQNEKSALGMTLDQRAVMLATAVSIDFDYFSRHSQHGAGGWLPLWMSGGGETAGEAGAAGAAGGAAVGTEAGAGAVGEAGAQAAGRGLSGAAGGVGEGAIAGAASMAGYEAMQRGMGRRRNEADDASPTAQDPYGDQSSQAPGQQSGQQEEVWGDNDPWTGRSSDGDGGASGGGGGEGGGWLDSASDFFGDS